MGRAVAMARVTDAHAFYARSSLNIESYDARAELAALEGEVEFYLRRAATAGGPVLDLGGGTGRIAWPLAENGHEVTSLDISEAMLVAARAKASQHPGAVGHISFVRADMRSFELDTRFALAITPGRVFQSLLTPDDQRRALRAIHRHLRPDGAFVAQLFDPRLEWCTPMDGPVDHPDRGSARSAATGNAVLASVLHRVNDPLRQVLTERWAFLEVDRTGTALRREEEVLELRWTYRHEMRHLLELEGFAVEAEYSDFRGSEPAYAAEQIWIARRVGI